MAEFGHDYKEYEGMFSNLKQAFLSSNSKERVEYVRWAQDQRSSKISDSQDRAYEDFIKWSFNMLSDEEVVSLNNQLITPEEK